MDNTRKVTKRTDNSQQPHEDTKHQLPLPTNGPFQVTRIASCSSTFSTNITTNSPAMCTDKTLIYVLLQSNKLSSYEENCARQAGYVNQCYLPKTGHAENHTRQKAIRFAMKDK